ncbi:MAG: hypothetical protein CNE89_05840 [Sphingomonadaceae bacterium MED-G03]|jgi:hypothetical protein|nr:MAG: hypothetical protein CNE89_05840 [Sphingomonadaceae bacterium MED-G03]
MAMGLLFPAALAALIAVIVPLVIHIARRSEQQPTDFAALRWLRQKPRPRSRLRFDEWPLLLLRLLLLALVALFLARPVLWGAADQSPYVAVVPGARVDPAAFPDARLHWLAPGYPALDTPPPAATIPLASLVRQLDADVPQGAPITIVTPQVIEGADAQRIRLSRRVTWRIQPGAMPAARVPAAPPPSLGIRYDAAHADALRYLRAAALAWQPQGRTADPDMGDAAAPLPDPRHLLAWLAAGTVPEAVRDRAAQGGTVLLSHDTRAPDGLAFVTIWRDDEGAPLAEVATIGSGRMVRLTRPLRPAAMPVLLDADFPTQLRALLSPPVAAPSRAAARDYAPLTGASPADLPPQPLQPWLGLLIALLLCAERWMATRRSRSSAP